MYYLETSALVNAPRGMFETIPAGQVFTSSFAVMEFMKATSTRNFPQRKAKLARLLASPVRIEWSTPVERIQMMFDRISVRPGKQYELLLRPLINSYVHAASLQSLQSGLEKQLAATIEEVDEIYGYIQGLFMHVMQNDDFLLNIKQVFVCPPCFFAAVVVDKVDSPSGANREALYETVLSSYNGKADCFFRGCELYYRLYCKNKPNQNDLVDLLHFLYLEDSSFVLVSNDKKMAKLAKDGAGTVTMAVREFLATIRPNSAT